MKKTYKSILLFGLILAVLTFILQYSEYRYLVGTLDTNVYTTIVASLFTLVGIWIGVNLLKRHYQPTPKQVYNPSSSINEVKLKELNLNSREFEILGLIAQGNSNQEIADQLYLALPTIKTHVSNLYTKMDVKSRTQAIVKARAMELI